MRPGGSQKDKVMLFRFGSNRYRQPGSNQGSFSGDVLWDEEPYIFPQLTKKTEYGIGGKIIALKSSFALRNSLFSRIP
jgi:hypothetical protein